MKNTIKRIAAVTIAGAGLAVAGAGTAHADLGDEVGFLRYLTDKGLYMTGPNQAGRFLSIGYDVCQARATNSSVDIAEYVYHNADASVTRRGANAFVAASVAFLCPVYLNTPVYLPGNAPAPAPTPYPLV
jgi:hypothetical protein